MKNLLIDTNIFLEILLDQEKKNACKDFLNKNIGHLFLSDFSLHSIGVILLRNKKDRVFEKFVHDVLHTIQIITLSKEKYLNLAKTARKFKLDFDDSYQTCIALEGNLEIVTMDKDFLKVREIAQVRLI